MPEAAIQLVTEMVYRIFLAAACEEGYHCYELIPADAVFLGKLIVTDTNAGFAALDDTVQNVLAVIAAVQGDIVFFYFFGERR